ncbi:MAG: response regulator [Pyrinomonadaceae bacterium]
MLEWPTVNERDETFHRTKTTGETILVVEDFDDTRFMIKLSLELNGYRVLEAVNGQQAVDIARRQPLDLILMDLGLPVLDGFAATCLIREDARLRDMPIVAVTAHATAEDRVRAYAAGCDEYVTKPLDFEKLAHLLGDLLGGD